MMLSIVTISNPACPNVKDTPKAPMAMPIEPVISKGLRPHFSTVRIATRVKRILTTPMMIVCIIGFSMPISPKMRGA